MYNRYICPLHVACEAYLLEVMGWESSDVVRFDLGLFLQVQTKMTKLKSAYNALIIGPTALGCKPTYKKSRSGNLLIWPDVILGPSFKVK